MAVARKKPSSKAKAFLDALPADPKAWQPPAEVLEIIDEANRRRLDGAAISLSALIRSLIAAFDIPVSEDGMRSRIMRRVKRSTW